MSKFFSSVRVHLRWYILVSLIVLSIILWLVIFHEDRDKVLTFAVLNVGQGDALFIESPTGIQVLVDGGPDKSLLKEIPHVLPWYDRSVDMIVVTNPDRDHYEGFIPFLDKYSAKVILEPGTTNISSAYNVLEKKIQDKKITKVLARRGQIVDLGGGAYIEIFFPDRDIGGLSPNDGSIIMRLVYRETSVMLQGDSTSRIEEYLLTLDKEKLDSDILKVGHHGSKTSSIESYVDTVSPKWSVISSGISNTYGHPHKETLDTMEKLNVLTLNTCNNGRIIFESDGKEFTLKNKNPKEAVGGCK